MKHFYFNLLLFFFSILSLNSQTLGVDFFNLATDEASNYINWTNGSNSGSGFGVWTFDNAGSSGQYKGNSGVGDPSFALYSVDPGNFANATRTFNAPLKSGDRFSIDIGHSSSIATGGEVFLQLLNGSDVVFTLKFVGGTSSWKLNDGANDFDISQGFSANTPLNFTFTYNGGNSYSYTFGSASGVNFIASTDLTNIDGFKFESKAQGGGQNFGANNPRIDSKYTIASGNTVVSSGDTTIPYLDIQGGSTLTVPSTSSITVTGNVNNSGDFILNSTSTEFSSLIVNGVATGNVVYNRYTNANSNGNDLIAPPVNSEDWSVFLGSGTNAADLVDAGDSSPTTYGFGPFDKSVSDYVNYTSATSATLLSGKGYRAATDVGTTLAFTGSVLTGAVPIDIIDSGSSFADWNLIGNPYPAYVDIKAFLEYEVASGVTNMSLLEGASGVYGFDGNAANGWDVITLANAAGRFFAPGQGFFVAADGDDVAAYDLVFTPGMRSASGGDDFIENRDTTTQPTFLELSAITANDSYVTDFYFNDNSTRGLDPGYDAVIWGGVPPTGFSIYSITADGSSTEAIALQSLNTTDINDVTIPLGVHSNQGEQLTFTINDSNLPAGTEVYLDDTTDNSSTLLTNGDYVLTPGSDLDGSGRFFLRFSNTVLSTPENSTDVLRIYTNRLTKTIGISGPGLGESTAKLYDLQGRLVLTQTLDSNSNSQSIPVANLSAGIYVVKLNTINGQHKTQKVILGY